MDWTSSCSIRNVGRGVGMRITCKKSFRTDGCSRGIARMGQGVPHVGHLSTAGFAVIVAIQQERVHGTAEPLLRRDDLRGR